jgi:hypothetical protein
MPRSLANCVLRAIVIADSTAKPDAQYCASEWRTSHKNHMGQRVDVNIIIEDCKSGIQAINLK